MYVLYISLFRCGRVLRRIRSIFEVYFISFIRVPCFLFHASCREIPPLLCHFFYSFIYVCYVPQYFFVCFFVESFVFYLHAFFFLMFVFNILYYSLVLLAVSFSSSQSYVIHFFFLFLVSFLEGMIPFSSANHYHESCNPLES